MLLAALQYLAGLAQPAGAVWDESYYLTAIARYEARQAQFASHPPLGLLLLAAGSALSGDNAGLDLRQVAAEKKVAGDQLPKGFSFRGPRLAAGVFAVLGAGLFFALMLELGGSVSMAVVLSSFYLFENSFLAQFRAAHLDAFQICFALLALLAFVRGLRVPMAAGSRAPLVFGLACGLAMMVRLNAVALLPMGALLCLRRPLREGFWPPLRDGLALAAGLGTAVVLVIVAHVVVGRHAPDTATAAGRQDAPYVTGAYRDYLDGRRGLTPAVVAAAGVDYAHFITSDFQGMARTDVNDAGPLDWLLLRKPISYRWDSDGVVTRYVQLLANPASWVLALLAVVVALWCVATAGLRPPSAEVAARRALMAMLLAAYAGFLAINFWLGARRVLYLYHYFLGLLMAFCLVPLVWRELCGRWPVLQRFERHAAVLFCAVVWLAYSCYAPLSLHRPLTHDACERRNLLQHVVDCRPAPGHT